MAVRRIDQIVLNLQILHQERVRPCVVREDSSDTRRGIDDYLGFLSLEESLDGGLLTEIEFRRGESD